LPFKDPKIRKAYHSAYYEENKASWEQKYEENREVILAYKKADRDANPEKYKKLDDERYAKNPQKEIKRALKWAKENPDKKAAANAKRLASKLQRTPKWLSIEQLKEIEQFYTDANYLTNLTKTQFEVDHILPLQGKTISGLHVPWNLQLLTASENASKGNRLESAGY
jgi:HNH endonuclease